MKAAYRHHIYKANGSYEYDTLTRIFTYVVWPGNTVSEEFSGGTNFRKILTSKLIIYKIIMVFQIELFRVSNKQKTLFHNRLTLIIKKKFTYVPEDCVTPRETICYVIFIRKYN